MQALVWRNGRFQFEEYRSRSLRRNEVRVSVRAIGVNRADILQRRGLYPPPKFDPISRLECAGVIIEVSKECGKSGLDATSCCCWQEKRMQTKPL